MVYVCVSVLLLLRARAERHPLVPRLDSSAVRIVRRKTRSRRTRDRGVEQFKTSLETLVINGQR